ncbi:MAG TPA: hypothetical protein EYN66_21630 [Myxococcales bacterium]|nr:hypothetical protein [Myxococcales bacterium]
MKFIQAQSDSSNLEVEDWEVLPPVTDMWGAEWKQKRQDMDRAARLQTGWAHKLAAQHRWDEMVTCTFAGPQLNGPMALHMFKSWLHTRYLDHAVSVGQAATKITNKIGPDDKQVYKMQGTWVKDPDGYDHLDRWVQTKKMVRHTKYLGPFANAWKKYDKFKPIYMVAIEKHKSGGKHLHALVKHRVFQDTLRRTAGWQGWHGERGYGRLRIEPPKDQQDCRSYVSKHYTTKDGDIQVSDSWPGHQSA